MLKIRDLFDGLPVPVPAGGPPHFSAHSVPGCEAHRIGKDPDGAPCLLLHVASATGGAPQPPIILNHVAVQHDVSCRISRPESPLEEAVFTLIRCLTGDPLLRAIFLDVMEVVVRAVGAAPSADRVRRAIEELVELFRSLDRPPRKSARGVWAELFLMTRARDVPRLAAAWHAAPGEAFDFSEGATRIEVKAASGGTREHYFSLTQVHPPHGVSVLIASLFAETLVGGMRITGLLEALRIRLARCPELVLRIESVTAQSLGKSFALGLEESFDLERAEESLRFFEPHVIPAVPKNLPREVTDVRFRSDLSGCVDLAVGDVRQRGGLFEAL